jgi:hypothetical protein
MQERLAQRETEPEGETEPLVLPTIEPVELKRSKPVARAH